MLLKLRTIQQPMGGLFPATFDHFVLQQKYRFWKHFRELKHCRDEPLEAQRILGVCSAIVLSLFDANDPKVWSYHRAVRKAEKILNGNGDGDGNIASERG